MNGQSQVYELDATSQAGSPWVTFRNSGSLYVRRWDGSSWTSIGSGFTPSGSGGDVANSPAIAVTSGGTPVIAARERANSGVYQIWVTQWNGSTWNSLGGVDINSQNGQAAITPSIAIDSANDVVVSWSEKESGGAKENRIWVKRWNGATWTQLGTQLNNTTNDAFQPSVKTIGTTPYVAFVEDDGTGVDLLRVKQWTGATWAAVGAASLNLDPTKSASDPSLYMDSGTPYVTWVEPDASGKRRAIVKRWTGAAWAQEGTGMTLQTAENASRPRLLSVSGTRYLAWTESYGARGGRAAIASWTGAAWSAVPEFGIDPRWAQRTQYATPVDSGGSVRVVFAEGTPARALFYELDPADQTAAGTLVPNADLASSQFSKRSVTWTTCVTGTTLLYTQINEDIEQPLSTACIPWQSAGEYIYSTTDAPLATVDLALTNAYPLVMAYSLQVQVRARRSGTKASTLVARLRKADNSILGTPVTWNLTDSYTTYSYPISGLNLNLADVDGLHLDIEATVGGAGTATAVHIATANVDLNYVGTDCGSPPCPPIRPDNVAPIGGTASANPTLEASDFVDTDFDTHTDSQWQVRTDSGSWASPFEDTGATSTDLTTHVVATTLTLDETYWFRVRYRDSTGSWSSWSTETSFAYDTTPPDPPQGRRLTSRTVGSVDVTWNDAIDDHSSSEALRYDVDLSTDGTTWAPLCSDMLGPQGCLASVGTQATPTYFRIRATDEAGNVGAWGHYADATAATYYLRETVGSTLLTNAAVGRLDSTAAAWTSTTTPNLNGLTGFWQYQRATTATAAASVPASINPATTGRGWMFDLLSGASVNDGTVTLNFETTAAKNNGTGTMLSRMFTTATSAGNVAAPTSTPDVVTDSDNALAATSALSHVHVRSLSAPTAFAAGTSLYFETWLEVTVASGSSGGAQAIAMTGTPSLDIAQPGQPPSAASALSPAASATTTAPLTMQATYAHGSGVAGHLVFEVWSDAAGSPDALLETGYSAFELASGGTAGSYSTVTLDPGAYHWRVRSEDRQGRVSAWSPYRAVTVVGPSTPPDAPVHVSPANLSATSDTTPDLTATFTDPDAPDTGTLTFEVCTVAMTAGQSCAGAGGAVLASGSTAAGIANGANATWTSTVLSAGTRYWHVRATDDQSTVGPWSASWRLEVGTPAMSIGVDTATRALSPSPAGPGVDATATSVIDVTTNNATGYSLYATDPSDSWGLEQPAVDTFPDWTGSVATPTTWTAGTSGYFGITVLCAATSTTCSSTGTKDTARWGTGFTATDFAANRYAGLTTASGLLHQRTTFDAATSYVVVGFRANASNGEQPGSYATTISFTAVANP